ncbi:hypothetical protein ACFY2H_04795 [Streptomyces griseofuscus]|uniref:hypothetical protein n=1 Tax=Streptomyces griseofuscus TaxID=146922 RepID=UPI003695D0CE
MATAHTLTERQLAGWGLCDLVFTTEMIVSGLVTNAIRYAPGTIQVRLVRERSPICEVTGCNSAAPYVRHPGPYPRRGKAIWAAQALPPATAGTPPAAPETGQAS